MTIQRHLRQHGALGPVLVFMLALLLSQALGLLHGIVHAPQVASEHVENWMHAEHAVADHPHEHDDGALVSRFFAGHSNDSGSAECRLYNLSSHCDAMPGVAVLVLPLVLLPFVFSGLPGLAVARWHALFQARGPPSVR